MNTETTNRILIWNDNNLNYLIKWWPHFGSRIISDRLHLSIKQIKSKVNKLKLKLLPKKERLCAVCMESAQHKRHSYCHDCYYRLRNDYRHDVLGVKKRLNVEPSLRWISRITTQRRSRRGYDSDLISYEYMYKLWKLQNGKCHYSGLDMNQPIKGKKRTMYSASIDRLDNTKGYIQGNVVWCCWFYNQAKCNLEINEFIMLCSLVEHHLKTQQ
jgi:hypothetical protein